MKRMLTLVLGSVLLSIAATLLVAWVTSAVRARRDEETGATEPVEPTGEDVPA